MIVQSITLVPNAKKPLSVFHGKGATWNILATPEKELWQGGRALFVTKEAPRDRLPHFTTMGVHGNSNKIEMPESINQVRVSKKGRNSVIIEFSFSNENDFIRGFIRTLRGLNIKTDLGEYTISDFRMEIEVIATTDEVFHMLSINDASDRKRYLEKNERFEFQSEERRRLIVPELPNTAAPDCLGIEAPTQEQSILPTLGVAASRSSASATSDPNSIECGRNPTNP